MNNKGFTILESVISIGIFSFVCVSVLGLISISNKSSEKNEDFMIASSLVSEGIEVLTTLRDNNFLNNLTYTTSILNSDRSFVPIFNNVNNTWSLSFGNDNNTETINSCISSTTNSCRVYKSTSGGYYVQSRNNANNDLVATKFYRLLTLQTGTGYFKIISTVLWNDYGVNKTISSEKNLYNWK